MNFKNFKHGSTTMSITAIIFISIIAVMFAIYTSSGASYQTIQGTSVTTSLNNINIIQNQSNAYQNISGTPTNSTSSSQCGVFCVIQTAYCGAVSAIPVLNFGCNTGNPVLLNKATQIIGFNVGSNGQHVSNNNILGVVGSPFGQAMIVLGVFLSMGVLAGLLGAGILARVMALAGLALSLIIYTEGQLSQFQGMPTYLWWMINGIFTAIMVVIVWEAFDSGGLG